MPINQAYDEEAVVAAVASALEDFYTSLIAKVNKLTIKNVVGRKNPYLFRAKAMNGAAEIVEAILSATVSSSEETIFGNAFFEPVAIAASGGRKALTKGLDNIIETGDTIYAIAVKSGTRVFNDDSRSRQEQNFTAAGKLAQQARKRFIPIVGYGYGRKQATGRGRPKLYHELAGEAFWTELTGDSRFYIKLVGYMGNLPEHYVDDFRSAYHMAANRLVRDFTREFCLEDGSIDWEKLVKFNSGVQRP